VILSTDAAVSRAMRRKMAHSDAKRLEDARDVLAQLSCRAY
jgi:hypothetical protein